MGDGRGLGGVTTMLAADPPGRDCPTTRRSPKATASVAAIRTLAYAARPTRPDRTSIAGSQRRRLDRLVSDWTAHGSAAVSAGSGGVLVS